LARKLRLAIPEKLEKYEEWATFSAVLDPLQVAEWTKDVEAWEFDPSCPNPFQSRVQGEQTQFCCIVIIIDRPVKVPNQADVRLELARQDMQEVEDNSFVRSDVSPSATINLGMELEDQQLV
jgi:hypothetical protein